MLNSTLKEMVDLIIHERMQNAFSQIKLAPEDYDGAEQGYLKVMDTLPPEQEKAIKTYCDMVFVSGARTEEFYYRQGLKDGINLKHTMKKVLRSLSES